MSRKVQIFLAKGPVYHYTYSRWRLRRWRLKRLAHSFIPDKAGFLAQIDLAIPALAEAKQAAAAGKIEAALASIAAYFRNRVEPVFFFDESCRQKLTALIPAEQRQATIQSADEICQNIFRFRRAGPVKFEDKIDWRYSPQENIDWRWDLNRHAYFETLGRAYWYTGDEKYAQTFRGLVLDWLATNPARVDQANWSSIFEAGFRINPWIWAFYYFRQSPSFDDEAYLAFLRGLLAHGLYLEANLELHVQNNHLLLEAKALAMLGLLFPEFKQAGQWRKRGLETLYQQLQAQVCEDGVHGERASLYHRIIAGEVLELLALLDNNNIPAKPEIKALFTKLVEFELWLTKPNGQVPLFGDSALEDTYLRFSATAGGAAFLNRHDLKAVAPPLDEATLWLLGPERVRQYLETPATAFQLASRDFPAGGYFVMRQGQDAGAAYLAFDCGPFGYKPVSSHGHADALSFELYALGQTFLVDPGVYGTRLGHAWRNFFRGSRAHNTVVVDQQDQSHLIDIWRVYRPAQTRLHDWLSTEQFDFVDGSHDGYERLRGPISHRRQIFFVKPEYWVVIDLLTGQGKHCFDLYFHLMPDQAYRLEAASGTVSIGGNAGPGLIIAPLPAENLQTEVVIGETIPAIQGWVSLFSGEKQPAPTLRYHREASAPVQFCTVLYPYPAGKSTCLSVSPLNIRAKDNTPFVQGHLTGLQIETESYLDYLMIDRSAVKNIKVFDDYETSAHLVYLRRHKETQGLVRVIARDGDRLLYQGQPISTT